MSCVAFVCVDRALDLALAISPSTHKGCPTRTVGDSPRANGKTGLILKQGFVTMVALCVCLAHLDGMDKVLKQGLVTWVARGMVAPLLKQIVSETRLRHVDGVKRLFRT